MKQKELHGGNIWQFDGEMLDFSASLNPLGMPEQVAQAAKDAVAESAAYPDPDCTALRRAIAGMDGVPAEYIFCGNGAAELLNRIALAIRPKAAMVTAPTFGEYERALKLAGCKIRFFYLKEEQQFDLSERILRAVRPELDLLILCNPNNPTGRLIESGLIRKIADYCEKNRIFLLIDESFLPLSDCMDSRGCADWLSEYPHLILLRSMTKTYAMPGLRLGYLLTSNAELLENIRDCGQPWSVSLPAQRAGEMACSLTHWAEDAKIMISEQRVLLEKELQGFGYHVIPSSVNYILFQAKGDDSLRERLIEQHILIRSCASFKGLGSDWYRIAVRTLQENRHLIQALHKLEDNKRRE